MNDAFILDTCVVIAFLSDEPGADKVEEIILRAERREIWLYMNSFNFLEVYYSLRRAYGELSAMSRLNRIIQLPIRYVENLGVFGDVFLEAGRFKSSYKMSLADAILLASASILAATVVTSDHHELDIVEQNENIDFFWIR